MPLTGRAEKPKRATSGRTESFAAVVIGGGPAGALCAIGLASRGVRTLLVDKAAFPRSKVCGCCLNLAATATLDRCGLAELPRRLGAVPLVRWSAWLRGRSVQCPVPGGWSLSREAMDNQLLMQAAAAGAEVRTGTAASVVQVSDDGVRVALRHGDSAVSLVDASVAVVATGLAGGGVEPWLPWRQPPRGPLGAGVGVACPDGRWERGVIYMACGQDGYVGAVLLEDGRLDLAAALRSPARRQQRLRPRGKPSAAHPSGLRIPSLGQRMQTILQESGLDEVAGLESAAVAATPRLSRLRQVGSGPLIAIGDAAGYVEPFTGEGMAWAMQCGWAAANCVTTALPGNARSLGRRWSAEYRRLLRIRQLPCRSLAALLRHDRGRRVLFGTLRQAPWLAPAVMRYLNRP